MIRPRLPFPIAMTIMLTLFACQKENDPREYPQVKTLDVKGITSKGAIFCADISIRSDAPIIDHGFVWSQYQSNLDFEYGEKVSLGEFTGEGTFEAEISAALEANKEYYVKAYVKTQKHTVFGTDVSFLSLGSEGPIIEAFDPKLVKWGDEIKIFGRNFLNDKSKLKVYVGNFEASIIELNKNEVKFLLPNEIITRNNFISVEIAGNRNYFTTDTLKLIVPKITNFEPKTVTWGDEITISGDFPNYIGYNYYVLFDDYCITELKSYTSNSIKFDMPFCNNNISEEIRLVVNNYHAISIDKISLKLPTITKIEPKDVSWGDVVTIEGDFFRVTGYDYTVSMGGYSAEIIESTPKKIKFFVPEYLSTVNSKVMVSINGVSIEFDETIKLKPPQVKSISPNSVCFNGTFQIKGRYFNGYRTNIKIGSRYASITETIGDSVIYAKISSTSLTEGSYQVIVSVLDQIAEFKPNIILEYPKITKVEPYDVTFKDTLSIYGNFFDSNPSSNSVLINAACCGSQDIVYASPNLIKILVPTNSYYTNPYIRVESPLGAVYHSNAYKIIPPIVNSISKLHGRYGDTITITGKYFNPDKNYNYVSIGGLSPSVIYATPERADFILGSLTRGIKTVTFYNNPDLSALVTENFYYNSPYTIKSGGRYISNGGYSFSINGNGYAGGGSYCYSISKYDPNQNNWTTLSKLSDTTIIGPAYFSIDKKGYIISGHKTLGWYEPITNSYMVVYEFNSETNTISIKNNVTATPRSGSFSFAIGNKGYMGGGADNNGNVLSDFWEYNPTTDAWVQKPNFPGGPNRGSSGFVINNKAYILVGTKLWCYDQITDTWVRKNDFPGNIRYHFSSFAIENKGYIANGSPYFGYGIGGVALYNDLWVYNSETDLWSKGTPYPGVPSYGCASFVINSKAYFGLGTRESGYGSIYSDQFYEYDPTLVSPQASNNY